MSLLANIADIIHSWAVVVGKATKTGLANSESGVLFRLHLSLVVKWKELKYSLTGTIWQARKKLNYVDNTLYLIVSIGCRIQRYLSNLV